MTPTSLVTTLLHERGFADIVDLPANLLFDDAYRVTFYEPAEGWIALECELESMLLGSDPALQTKLLQWNRLPSVVRKGAFALGDDQETICYRLTFSVSSLDVEQCKALIHEFLNHVIRLGAALLASPMELDLEFADDVRTALPELMAGMISV